MTIERLLWCVRTGNLEGNPLHLDQLEIVEMLQTEDNPVLGLNVVIDDQRQLSFVRMELNAQLRVSGLSSS